MKGLLHEVKRNGKSFFVPAVPPSSVKVKRVFDSVSSYTVLPHVERMVREAGGTATCAGWVEPVSGFLQEIESEVERRTSALTIEELLGSGDLRGST